MRYKENFEMSMKRFEAFWNREILDRCCFSVQVNGARREKPPEDMQGKISYWTDPEWVIRRRRKVMENTYYGGDSLPIISMNLGPCAHAAFFEGAKYTYGDTTIWFTPSLNSLDEMRFQEDSFMYRKTLEMARALAEDSKGDYFISMPPFEGNMDAMAHLVGSEEVMCAMLEEPESVLEAQKKLEAAYERIMTDVYDITKDVNRGGGCTDWLRVWAPALHTQMQCDMSVMFSNDMYETFVMPELRAQCDFLEYPLYHFDGVEQLRHLDSLLSIPRLRAIQWMQCVNQKPCTEYIPELKRIQEAGKSIVLGVTPNQIRPIMENLSSKGLYLFTNASSKEEADAMVKEVERLTHE